MGAFSRLTLGHTVLTIRQTFFFIIIAIHRAVAKKPSPFFFQFISVVAETDNDGSHSFPTEKTWKPLIARHPVLFYATPNHENFLESLGFEMYVKTNSDTDKLASIVSDIAYGGWGDYTYRNWNSIADHNRRLTNAELWRDRLYRWLHENFVN